MTDQAPWKDGWSPFRLKKACEDCPFRNDRPQYLDRPRREEIARSLHEGSPFHCHKTLDYSSGEPVQRENSQACAGALATMQNGREENVYMALGRHLGLYRPDENPLEDQPVYGTLDEWAASEGPSA